MSMTLNELIDEVQEFTGRTDKRTQMVTALNATQKRIAQHPHPWMDLHTTSTLTTTASTETTAYPTSYMRALRLTVQDGTNSYPLTRIAPHDAEDIWARPEEDTENRPVYYIERGGQFEWRPIPDDTYSIECWHLVWPTDMSANTDTSTFSDLDAALVAGASARIREITSEFDEAKYWWSKFDQEVVLAVQRETTRADALDVFQPYGYRTRFIPERWKRPFLQ